MRDYFSEGIVYGLSADEYFAVEAVSASKLKQFNQTPASIFIEIEKSRSMVIGSAVHSLCLEGHKAFDSGFAVSPDIDKRTKEGKALFAEFQAVNLGKEILSQDEYKVVLECCKSVSNHPLAKVFLDESQGQPEVSLFWVDADTGLKCKARLDRLPSVDKQLVFDLKTTANASKKEFTYSMRKYAYGLQASWYLRGCFEVGLDVNHFIFIAVQTSEPYTCFTCYLTDNTLQVERANIDRLLNLYKECKQAEWFPNFEIPKHITNISQITSMELLDEIELYYGG